MKKAKKTPIAMFDFDWPAEREQVPFPFQLLWHTFSHSRLTQSLFYFMYLYFSFTFNV